jgi:hypothetical protein
MATVAGQMEDALPPDLRDYWFRRCSIVIGCWPLGYYRAIYDENGKEIGYSGRRDKFGDQVVGSYADKSSNHPPEEFHTQYAFATSFARRYNWIYGHGATWWHLSEKEAKQYGGGQSDRLPVDERLDDFKRIVQLKPRVTDPLLTSLAQELQTTGRLVIAEQYGLIKDWLVLGPFENKEDPPERHTALRTKLIDTSITEFPEIVSTVDGRRLTWQRCKADQRSGYVNAMPLFDPNTNMSYFALCYVNSPKRRTAQLRTGSNDGLAVWVNGEKIYEANRLRGAGIDDDIIDIVLPPGSCPILLQICQTGGTTGFYARITDEEGQPLDDLTFSTKP